jgi:hypothetical protein
MPNLDIGLMMGIVGMAPDPRASRSFGIVPSHKIYIPRSDMSDLLAIPEQ